MPVIVTIFAFVYMLCALGLVLFSLNLSVLFVLWLLHRNDDVALPSLNGSEWPTVTVQLPIYNENAVAERLIDTVAAMDYPRNRLQIQIVDDSDDETSATVAKLVSQYQCAGMNITHVQRTNREGFKAGGLAYGLQHSDDEFIAMFDADFMPFSDFLRRTIPYFVADSELGIIQTRWIHLNAQQNLLTRIQALGIDRHFVVEQMARNRGGLLTGFNGSGGVWRRSCIDDSGGWSGKTETEDLDLSYRAQMRGWHYLYLPDVEVAAELPPQIIALKRQQARWSKGTTQNLLQLSGRLWRCKNLNIFQKVMGTLHLCQYLPQTMLLILTLLTPPLLLANVLERLPLISVGVVSLVAPMMYLASQYRLYTDWGRRFLVLPILMAVGSGMVFNNTMASMQALLRRPSVFKRTPKFSDKSWQNSRYALRLNWTVLFEVLMIIYTAFGGVVALFKMPGMAPFLFLQTYGFGAVVFWSVFEEWKIRRKWPATKETSTEKPDKVRSNSRPKAHESSQIDSKVKSNEYHRS
jgi:cellulose synthase/poly-beta-1,6-N-acetylglucosamine synthase-like glycosyltransferase